MLCHLMPARRRIADCAWALVLLAGCSAGRDIAPVSGLVTIDGKPAPDVHISFQPQAAGGKEASRDATGSYATTDAQGKFTLQMSDTEEPGALLGVHSVRLADKLAAVEADAGPVKGKPLRFPARYSDGSLSFEVKPGGTDQANFELTSK
jgi:hypothetical protein